MGREGAITVAAGTSTTTGITNIMTSISIVSITVATVATAGIVPVSITAGGIITRPIISTDRTVMPGGTITMITTAPDIGITIAIGRRVPMFGTIIPATGFPFPTPIS